MYRNTALSPSINNNNSRKGSNTNLKAQDETRTKKLGDNTRMKGRCYVREEEDEKDVAEISEEKMEEDKELELLSTYDEKCQSQEGVSGETEDNPNYYSELRVNIENTENYKEYSQVANNKGGDNIPAAANQSAKPKITSNNNKYSSNNNNNSANSDEFLKERKLLEFYKNKSMLSKFEAENTENEKSRRRRNSRNGRNTDLDEMYRLPTEHLCLDRDYSNERIKQKQLAKMHRQQRQCLARYRDELNELNERLKEASLDGAVGGVDLTEEPSHNPDMHSYTRNICISEPIYEHPGSTMLNRRFEVDIVNQHRLVGDCRQVNNNDGFSSPEELPSSPRASFSTTAGARPKKSPRKQKAL